MKVLIVGMGSIGRRHCNNILSQYPDYEVIALRHAKTTRSESPPCIYQTFYSLSDALDAKPDVAFITNPSPLHIQIAIALAERGVHMFIEKPLSDNLNGVNEFREICKRNQITVMVGYNLRFMKSLQALKDTVDSGLIGTLLSYRSEVGQYLPNWRSNADYRHSVSARKEMGGGVLLELSHEIDYARWILGDIDFVSALSGICSNLEIDVEDIAEIVFQSKSGIIGSIHLDMVNQAKTRTCTIIGSKGTLVWDGIENSLKIYTTHSPEWSYIVPPQPTYGNQMYLDEIGHFFNCIKEGKSPVISISDGIAVLEIIQAIRESSIQKRCIFI